MRLFPLLLVLLASPVFAQEPKDRPFRAGLIVAAAVAGADIATTAQAAERGGFREANPVFRELFQEPALLGLANGALTAGVAILASDLNTSHPRWAKALLWTWTAFRGWIVVRNVRVLKGQR